MGLLSDLRTADEAIKVGLVGAGVFGRKLINQIEAVPGMTTAAIADVDPAQARKAFWEAGIPEEEVVEATNADAADAAIDVGNRALLTDGVELTAVDVDVVVEATGLPGPGAKHAFHAIQAGKHVVMVTVETDVVVGPLLAELAAANDVIYSMAYGDQPALIVELVEWARVIGLEIVAAGKGTPFVDSYRYGTPDDALERWGFDEAFIAEHDPNPKMYNSFLDGTKAAVEMCAVINATDLNPDVSGLHIPPAELSEVPNLLRPEADGGVLSEPGAVDMVSTLASDGSKLNEHMDANVFVVTTTDNRHASEYLAQKAGSSNWHVSDDGSYQLFYRPWHLPGTETTVSIAKAARRNEATGVPRRRGAEVAAMAKCDLRPGDELDGGGGYTISGYVETRERADTDNLVPFGLLEGAKVVEDIEKGSSIGHEDIELDTGSFLYHLWRVQELS